MDLLHELGHLALATRLKRLSERLQQEVSEVYAEQGLGIHARWFPVLQALSRRSPQGISELAQGLGLTHTAVAQVAGPMERCELVASSPEHTDGRRRLLHLTPRGEAAMVRLAPLWREVEAATRHLVAEAGHDLLAAVDAVEERLDARSMGERLRARLEQGLALELVPYESRFSTAFRDLNLAWMQELGPIDARDLALLEDPEGRVLAGGGEVHFALAAGEPVGTLALFFHGEEVAELAKVAVAEPVRGRGVGRALVQRALARARERGARLLFLYTAPELRAAVALYRSLGFREVAAPPVRHPGCTRPSVVLQLELGAP